MGNSNTITVNKLRSIDCFCAVLLNTLIYLLKSFSYGWKKGDGYASVAIKKFLHSNRQWHKSFCYVTILCLSKCKQLLEMSIKHNRLQLSNIVKLCLKLALEPTKTGSRTCQPSTFPLGLLGSPDAITHIYDLVNTKPFST